MDQPRSPPGRRSNHSPITNGPVPITNPLQNVNAGTVSVKSPSAGKMNVTWEKKTGVSGYHIRYGKKKDFSDAKKITINKQDQSAKLITGLSKGKKYYVQVRCYKKVGNTIYCTGWSSTKSVTVK